MIKDQSNEILHYAYILSFTAMFLWFLQIVVHNFMYSKLIMLITIISLFCWYVREYILSICRFVTKWILSVCRFVTKWTLIGMLAIVFYTLLIPLACIGVYMRLLWVSFVAGVKQFLNTFEAIQLQPFKVFETIQPYCDCVAFLIKCFILPVIILSLSINKQFTLGLLVLYIPLEFYLWVFICATGYQQYGVPTVWLGVLLIYIIGMITYYNFIIFKILVACVFPSMIKSVQTFFIQLKQQLNDYNLKKSIYSYAFQYGKKSYNFIGQYFGNN